MLFFGVPTSKLLAFRFPNMPDPTGSSVQGTLCQLIDHFLEGSSKMLIGEVSRCYLQRLNMLEV
jgi:hypothetical protein